MSYPVALTIAGSDCSGGAGLQADLKTFSSYRVHGLTAVTCIVSETPLVVRKVHPVPPALLADQVDLLLASYPIGAIKTGMLYSKEHIDAVCKILQNGSPPLVVDPVMVASTGDALMRSDAVNAISTKLLPLASVITPNIPEAEQLLGRKIANLKDHETAAHQLVEKFHCACYLKGGHLDENGRHYDFLVHDKGHQKFEAPHLDLPQSHGTGCTFAAALTAGLAKGESLTEAAAGAHQFTHEALKRSFSWQTVHSNEEIYHLDQNQHPR